MVAIAEIKEHILDEKLTELEKARQWSPRVISKLETFIRTGDDYDLFRVNPISYAADRGMAEQEAIDLFLYGVKFGLFEMEWHLICKMCGLVVDNFRTMDKLHGHYLCQTCGLVNDVTLDDYIQVAFTLSNKIRDLVYHHPEQLSPIDYCLKYSLSKGILPFPDGTAYDALAQQFTPYVAYLEPGTSQRIEFEAVEGILWGSDLINKTGMMMFVGKEVAPEPLNMKVKLIDGRLLGIDPTLVPQRADLGPVIFELPMTQIPAGKVHLAVENEMATRGMIWVFNPPQALIELKTFNEYEPFLSGKRLLSNQTFRDLFRSEVVQSDEGLGVRDITFMFTDLKGSTALYDQIGDAKAYYLVRQHFDTLGRVIVQHEGAVVKTIGDAVMATFVHPKAALAAALGMLAEIEKFNEGISEKLILKIGIHRGHSIVVTLNDRLDYFGQTVNIAARVQNLAGAGEIVITEQVREAPGVEELVEECSFSEAEETMLRGVGEKMRVYRIKMR